MDDSRQFVILAVQLLALAAVVTVAAWPLACGGRRRRLDLLATAVSVTLLIGWVTWEPDSRPSVLEAAELTEGVSSQRRKVFKDHLLPRQATGSEYVSSQTCRSCHPGQFSTWHRTFHRTMTQAAGPDSVIPAHSGQFDGKRLESRGRHYELSRRGDEFWARMVDPDWDRDRRARGPLDQ